MTDELLVFGVAGALLLTALITVAFVVRRRRVLLAELGEVALLLRALESRVTSPSGLVAAIRQHVVRDETPDGPRYVLSKPLAVVRREYAEGEVAHSPSFSFGGLLTAFALICTFLLIAWVMTTDVSGAIKNDADSGQLSDAVAKLGAKFLISAAGIGGSVIALFFSNSARGAIYRAAEHPPVELLTQFSTIEAEQLKAKWHELELARAERELRAAESAQTIGYLASLDSRAQKLNSIEVSVQTIGNEVSANLKNIMKDAMAEQLRDIMAEVMVRVEGMARKMEEQLTDVFSSSLHALSTDLKKALDAVQKAIEGQSQGQLEKILEKLQNTVSGGFHDESKKMVAALDSFARVIPSLEQQLRQMTGAVADETRKRNDDTAQLTERMFGQISSLMDSLATQQTANAGAIERLQAVSEQGAEAMARRLEYSGSTMVSNVLSSSRAEIESIVQQLRASAEASAQRHSDVEARASHAAATVTHAANGLQASAQSLIDLANTTATMLTNARQGGEAMHHASREFINAGNALLNSVNVVHQVVEDVRLRTVEHSQLLERQRGYTKEVEQLWPTLFDAYLAKFKASSEELGRTWDVTHSKIAAATSSVGSEFADNTAALSEAVDKLVRLQGGRGG